MRFNKFNPLEDDHNDLPDSEGVYIITVRSIAVLPQNMRSLSFSTYYDESVIYIGIATSLKKRGCNNHLLGTARNSTLRKSLGTLFKLRRKQFPNEVGTSKFRFVEEDEKMLTKWIGQNLMIYYFVTNNPKNIEKDLIEEYYPPLNIQGNRSNINAEFRKELSRLRK